MIRLFFVVVVGGAVAAALLGINVWRVVVPLAVLAAAAYTVGGLKLRCPSCRKRVKIGATACHHCGRPVSGRSAKEKEALTRAELGPRLGHPQRVRRDVLPPSTGGPRRRTRGQGSGHRTRDST